MRIVGLLICVLITQASVAQSGSVVVDTLDWKNYFPLAVGNEWEYGDGETYQISFLSIESDTTVNSFEYFETRQQIFLSIFPSDTLSLVSDNTRYLRYDTSGVVFWFSQIEDDNGVNNETFSVGFKEFRNFDFRMSFGASSQWGVNPNDVVFVGGGYEQNIELGNSQEVLVLGAKFYNYDIIYHGYAWGIGFLGGGNLSGPRLKYAKVGGDVFGARLVSNDIEEVLFPSEMKLEVYPNPANVTVTVTMNASFTAQVDVVIVDVLGREYVRHSAWISRNQSKISIDIRALSAGMYYLIVLSERRQFTKSFIVSR